MVYVEVPTSRYMPDHGTKHIIMLSIIIIQLLYKSYICSVPFSALPKLGTKNLYMSRYFRKLENGTKNNIKCLLYPICEYLFTSNS